MSVGVAVDCTVCRMRKKPVGRDAPAAIGNSLCDHECPGYYEDPKPGFLWPGESDDSDVSPKGNSQEKT